MRLILAMVFMVIVFAPSLVVHGDSIDGRVIQVILPSEDITLGYVESRGPFTVELRTSGASVQGQKLYIGDGKLAIDLVADESEGVFLQGVHLKSGHQFKKGATIAVRPGYKKASDLSRGDVYVTLPGVKFEHPKEFADWAKNHPAAVKIEVTGWLAECKTHKRFGHNAGSVTAEDNQYWLDYSENLKVLEGLELATRPMATVSGTLEFREMRGPGSGLLLVGPADVTAGKRVAMIVVKSITVRGQREEPGSKLRE